MKEKIYCAGAIRGVAGYKKFIEIIINVVEENGSIALHEQKHSDEIFSDKEIYQRDLKWLNESNKLIAEVSGASTGVGFEISYALFVRKIQVLALVNSDIQKISAMLTGCDSDLLTIKKYNNENELKQIVKSYLNCKI